MSSMTRREKEKKKMKYTSARDWADKQDSGFEPTSISLPKGTPFFSLKKTGLYKIDILPYLVGKGNPHADEGMYHYERTYYPHRVTAATGKKKLYCCLSETFGKKCPICDWMGKAGHSADPELIKSLRPQVRMLWNVIDRNEKEKGVQVWDSAYFKSFGEMLKNKIQAVEEYEDFFKLEGGMTLQLSVNEASFAGQKFNQVTNIEMLKRSEDYSEDILDKTVCLDDCPIEMKYDALNNIFLQTGGEEEESSNGHVKAKSKDDEPLDLDEDDEDEKPSARGSDSEDDDDEDSDIEEEDSDVEEDSEDSDSDLESDEDDEEEDSDLEPEDSDVEEEPAPKKKPKKVEKPVKKKKR